MKSQTEVLVIGGGILGCSLLYRLTRLGVGDCRLVEKDELTAGTTWRSAACRTHFSSSPFLGAHHLRTTTMYEGLEADTGYGHRVEKSIALASLPAQLAEPGTALDVEAPGERLAATVVRMALYNRA